MSSTNNKQPKMLAWSDDVCKFNVHDVRLRARIGKAGGKLWKKVLDGDLSNTKFQGFVFDPEQPTKADDDAEEKAKDICLFHKINGEMHDAIASSLGVKPVEVLIAAQVLEGDGAAAHKALQKECGS